MTYKIVIKFSCLDDIAAKQLFRDFMEGKIDIDALGRIDAKLQRVVEGGTPQGLLRIFKEGTDDAGAYRRP